MAEESGIELSQDDRKPVPAGKMRPRGRPFAGKDDPRAKVNRALVPPVGEPPHEVGDGAPPILKDMRWAYRNLGVNCSGTPAQESFRRSAKKDPAKFAREVMRLDAEFKAQRDQELGKGAGEDGGPDEGEERLREVAGRLLREARG